MNEWVWDELFESGGEEINIFILTTATKTKMKKEKENQEKTTK